MAGHGADPGAVGWAALPHCQPCCSIGSGWILSPCSTQWGRTVAQHHAPSPALMLSPARCWSSMPWCNKAAFMQELLCLPGAGSPSLEQFPSTEHSPRHTAGTAGCGVTPAAIPVLSQGCPVPTVLHSNETQ